MRPLWFVAARGCAQPRPERDPDAPVGGRTRPGSTRPVGSSMRGAVHDDDVESADQPGVRDDDHGLDGDLIDAQAIVRADGPVAAHTPTLKAWMGGVVGGLITPAPMPVQDVVIPASTTQLVVTGMYDVRTLETSTITRSTPGRLPGHDRQRPDRVGARAE